MNNPYTPHHPARIPQTFFGRTHELADLSAFLRHNQSASIVGPPGMGKTSLLLYLAQPDHWASLQLDTNYLFIYFNCQSFTASTRDEIFTEFIKGIAAALNERGLPPEPTFEAQAANPARLTFETGIHRLNRRGLRVALSLDDFEYLGHNPALDVNFFSALRAAMGRYQLVLLTASTKPLIELTYAGAPSEISSSPFFNIFAQIELGPLDEAEARQLIHEPAAQAGLPFSPLTEEFLYTLSGGQPLRLQAACYYAFDRFANGAPVDQANIEQYTREQLAHLHTK